jgi:hypothetical protein
MQPRKLPLKLVSNCVELALNRVKSAHLSVVTVRSGSDLLGAS